MDMLRALALLAIAACTPLFAQNAELPNRAPVRVDRSQRIELGGHQPPWATPNRDLGRIPAGTPLAYMRLTLARSPQQEAAFQQLLRDQQNPRSPRYHQWQTPETIGANFGPTSDDVAAVKQWLIGQGLQVDRVAHSRMFVIFHGSAAQAEAAFHTELHSYATIRGPQIAISAPPQVPSALAPVIASVEGLASHPLRPGVHAQPAYSACYGSQCYHFIAPADFATIYGLTSVYGASVKGSGQTIAIIGRAQVWSYDITDFEGQTGLQTATPTLIVPPNGVTPPEPNDDQFQAPNDDQTEATLDVERSYGTAPAASVELVASLSTQTEDGADIAKDYVIDGYSTLHASIMSNSFGVCEADVAPSYVSSNDTLFQQAAAEGISSIGIAGDAGAAGCDSYFSAPPGQQLLSPNALCASSYVTCVGGTEFNDTANPAAYWSTTNTPTLGSALSYIPEGGWNEPLDSSQDTQAAAGGGGVSQYIATPYWQQGAGVPGTVGRYTPDIALPAASHDGYYGCYAAGGGNCSENYFEYFYGTSAGAPSLAGIVALLNQELGGAQGNLNPHLYLLAALDASTVYHDATAASSGITNCALTMPTMCNNSTPGPGNLSGGLAGYELTSGFDLVTGWGSVNAANLINDWASATPAATTTALSVSPSTTINSGATATLSATVTSASGTPTGKVTFSTQGVMIGTVNLNAGKASLSAGTTGLPLGKYPVIAQYSGSVVDSPSTSANVTVTLTNATSITVLSATPSTVTPPASVTLSATVTGGGGNPTGSVEFYYQTLALGSANLSRGKASVTESTGGLPGGSYGIHAVYSGSPGTAGSTSAVVYVTLK